MLRLSTQRRLEGIANEIELADHSDVRRQQRSTYLEDAWQHGASAFVDRVQRYARTETDEEIIIRPWFRDLLLLVGDLRVATVLVTGPSQIGKTLSVTLWVTDLLVHGKFSGAWFYDSAQNLKNNVGIQFQPIAKAWISAVEATGIRIPQAGDKRVNERWQCDQATMNFSYVSTARKKGSEQASVGGAGASFHADYAVKEERSQYPNAADFIDRRLDASMIDTKPIRELGTPGGGGGIESGFEDADRHFYPHFQCRNPDCLTHGQWQPLDPKGCLLRQSSVQDAMGQTKQSYFSSSGRPMRWWHDDPADSTKSAYFACPHCGTKIPDPDRYDAQFVCRKTRQTLSEFLGHLPPGIPETPYKVIAHLSPLTREQTTNRAAEMIAKGLTTESTTDWQQQMLGHPSETNRLSLSPTILRKAMKAPRPTTPAEVIIAGIDTGRSDDWIWIMSVHLPKTIDRKQPILTYEKAIRNVLLARPVMRNEVPALLRQYNVDFGLIDNEPSRETAMRLTQATCLELANQVTHLKDPVRHDWVEDGGRSALCWHLRSQKFLASFTESFMFVADDNHPLYRLPPEWDRHIGDTSPRSPINQLCGPYRDEDGNWFRGPGENDDLFYAGLFAEVALYIHLTSPKRNTSGAGQGKKRAIFGVLDQL